MYLKYTFVYMYIDMYLRYTFMYMYIDMYLQYTCNLVYTTYQAYIYFYNRKQAETPELVYATEANTAIPQMVIKFYESKLTWHEHTPKEESELL